MVIEINTNVDINNYIESQYKKKVVGSKLWNYNFPGKFFGALQLIKTLIFLFLHTNEEA